MRGFGSLPWACGVFWLLTSYVLGGVAGALILLPWSCRRGHPLNRLVYKTIDGVTACTRLAAECAREAGMGEGCL